MNNRSNDLTCRGCYDEAMGLLSQSLTFVKHFIACSDDCYACEENVPTFHFMISPRNPEEDGCDVGNNVQSVIFRKPIFVHILPRPGKTRFSHQHCPRLSFVILYNLALAHHLKAQSLHSTPGLARALDLYVLAAKIQQSDGFRFSDLETMAMLNNMGHIHKCLHHEASSRQCMERLFIMILHVQQERQQEGDSIAPIDDCFVLSVLPMIFSNKSLPDVSAAA